MRRTVDQSELGMIISDVGDGGEWRMEDGGIQDGGDRCGML